MKYVLMCLFAGCTWVQAQFRQEARVMDAGGGMATSLTFRVVGQSIGQAASMPLQSNVATNHHQGGFLTAVLLLPDLDGDGDGLADEVDPDNDNDGLSDAVELTGEAFDPVTPTLIDNPDSDGDGHSDGEEAFLGFNPRDASRRLVISSVTLGNRLNLFWQARAGRFYRISSLDLSDPENTRQTIATTTLLNGVGPWEEVQGRFSITLPPSPLQIYLIEAVEPP